MTKGWRGGEERGARQKRGGARKRSTKILPRVPKATSTANPDTEGRTKVGAGKDRDGKKAKPAPSWTEGPAKPSGQRRLWGTDESGSRRRAFPPHRLVLESPLRANRGVPIVREPRSPRGWGWGVGSFRVITAVFFLFLLAQLPPRPWPASEPSARTIRPVASGCPPIQLCERFR